MNAPHIVAQQRIPARKSRTLDIRLSPWRYQIRSLKLQEQVLIRTATDSKNSGATIRIHHQTMEPLTLDLAAKVSLTLQNDDDKDITLMIERLAGNEQAATASMVIAMNEFRTLFSQEVLSPDTPISVGAVALMFTDLKASTNLYEEIGEAPAYALVSHHFRLLRDAIAKCDGAIVKTIGDAVMAAFFDPAKAVEAALEMNRTINEDNATRGKPALTLKIGIHHGPCIAVNMNDILDYFGTAVNLAARIQRESRGGDIVVSEEVWSDPQVKRVLAERKLECLKESCIVRGLSGSRNIYRIQTMSPTTESQSHRDF
jgi:class 3 adenylate cyclase